MIRDDGDNTPIIGEITRGPFANPHMAAILKKFGKKAFARSSALMEFEAFLHRINKHERDQLKTMTCLEIGTFYGVTAVVLSQFFQRVVCVSVDEMPVQMKHDIVAHLGIQNIRFFDVQNNDEKAALVNNLQFDFCYQDGDHAHDTTSDFSLVKRCGRVLFHEYTPLQAPVHNLVHSLPKEEVIFAHYDWLAYWSRRG
jgi:protein-L-isoaspartate O-methyltransferase